MRWRMIDTGKKSPAENMAVDEAIFSGLQAGNSDPSIRFYDWNPPAVSIGYHQEIEKEIDMTILKKNGLGFVRRPTGGRAVLHKNEITYSVICPIRDRMKGNVLDTYIEISSALISGFRKMGIVVELEKGNLSSRQQRMDINPCFNSRSRFELSFLNKKIVGSAQVRKGKFLLQHGSILLNDDQSGIAYIIPGISDEQRKRLSGFLSEKTIAVNQILEEKKTYKEAVLSFMEGFRENWKTDEFYESRDLTEKEEEKMRNLFLSKYQTDVWNLRK